MSEIERAVSKDWWKLLHFVWHHHYNDTKFKENAINCAKHQGVSQVYIDYAIELGTFNKDFDLYIVPEVVDLTPGKAFKTLHDAWIFVQGNPGFDVRSG